MSRKPKKGYFVRGQFVAEGSELDVEMKAELKGTADATRTDLKRESTELQKLGEELLILRPDARLALALPEKLEDALEAARKITNFEGRRRQGQFIGKLMRKLDDEQVAAVRTALESQQKGSAAEAATLHEAEAWRVALIDSDDSVQQWIARFPETDIQQLRALVRQARKDAVPEKAGAAPRHGRAYREIFQMVRSILSGGDGADEVDGGAPAEDDDDA